MLTIRKPIVLRTQKPMQGLRQDMAKRIQANYGLMNMSIRKEEMLHVTSEPPEVYFAEGDSIQIFNNIKNENQQEIRLDVINNLINRIMVSQTENFTYQDTVYISSILRRLGIRDEKLFMKQVFALQNEHKETRQLLQNYENHQEILKKFFLENQEKQKTEEKSEEAVLERERRYYIHDEIFQRLETGKIYQDMRQFSKGNRHESQQIYRTEMHLGEQATLEQNFLLQDLKQKITNNPSPLYYCHNNQYEYLQEISENITESLEEQMSAAILLNIVDQSYTLRQRQIEENSHYWYSIAGALFQTAENTWKRYEANLLERKFVSNHVLQVLDEVNQIKHLENTTIQNITDAYTRIEEAWKTTTQTQNQLMQNLVQMNRTEEVNISGGSYHLTQEELELQFLNKREEIENEENAITVEQLQKQLEVFNQQNYENYLKMEEIAKTQPQIKERKLDRKKAQRDALRALEHPNEVLKEYLSIEVHDPVTEVRKEVEAQIYEMFSDETKEIYRQFLLQNHTTDETFLQHIMDQPEEYVIGKESTQSLEHIEYQEVLKQVQKDTKEYTESMQPVTFETTDEVLRQQLQILNKVQSSEIYEIWTKPEEVILKVEQEEKLLVARMMEQQELIKQKSEAILTDSNMTISEETTKLLEKLIFVHPEDVSETEVLDQDETYRAVLQHVIHQTETTELQTEITKILEYVERQNLLKQIHQIATEHTEYVQPVVLETMNQKIKQQMQVFESLQTNNVYEKWTMPADVVWQIEQAEAEVMEENIRKQQEIRKKKNEISLVDSKVDVLEEATKLLEKQILLHPETILETEEIFQNIDFVHKVEEQFLNEELLEEIRMQKQNTRREEHTEQTTLESKTMSHQTVQETVNHMQSNRIEDIEELVQQSVKKQMNDLSDQVYGKLEKKLQMERKRRGYF